MALSHSIDRNIPDLVKLGQLPKYPLKSDSFGFIETMELLLLVPLGDPY
jgi:hypothetical protein